MISKDIKSNEKHVRTHLTFHSFFLHVTCLIVRSEGWIKTQVIQYSYAPVLEICLSFGSPSYLGNLKTLSKVVSCYYINNVYLVAVELSMAKCCLRYLPLTWFLICIYKRAIRLSSKNSSVGAILRK